MKGQEKLIRYNKNGKPEGYYKGQSQLEIYKDKLEEKRFKRYKK